MRRLALIEALAMRSIGRLSPTVPIRLLIVVAAATVTFASMSRLALAAQVRIPLTIECVH